MSKKFLVLVSAAIAALDGNNASATAPTVGSKDLANSPASTTSSSSMSGSPIQSIEYEKMEKLIS